jgi:hypothetical protein
MKRSVFTLAVVKTKTKLNCDCRKTETNVQLTQCDKICHDTVRGVGSFLRAIKKNGLAANNGDTLGEAVISVESNEFRLGCQENFNSKQQTEKLYFIIVSNLFKRSFKDVNQ